MSLPSEHKNTPVGAEKGKQTLCHESLNPKVPGFLAILPEYPGHEVSCA